MGIFRSPPKPRSEVVKVSEASTAGEKVLVIVCSFPPDVTGNTFGASCNGDAANSSAKKRARLKSPRLRISMPSNARR